MVKTDNVMYKYSVMIYDGSMGYDAIATYISQVTQTMAKSICRHFNRQISRQEQIAKCQIDIQYYVDCPDFHERTLEYWR